MLHQHGRLILLLRRLALLLTLLLADNPVDVGWADEVQLRNGDRLTGKIVKMEGDVLTFEAKHVGKVTIKTSEVERARADEPMKVLIHGEPGKSLLDFFSGGGEVVMATEVGAGTAIPLADVRAINVGPIQYQAYLSIGGNSTQGNTQTKAVNGSARVILRAYRQRLFLEGKYNYGEAAETVTARNSLANGKYDYFITKRIFLNSTLLLEKDTFQQLNLRTTVGGGGGYQFIETARTTLSGEAGIAYVNEHFTTAPSTETPSSRWAVRFNHELIAERLSVFHKHDAFYDLNHGNAFRVLADQGLRIAVYKGIFVNLEYDLRLNTQPAPGRQKIDEAFIFGIGYQFE
jgi:putative salt-induced outer membrane protein YdiY